MSTQDIGASPPASPQGDKPRGFSKFKRRVSRILGKDDVKRANIAAASSSAGPATSPPANAPDTVQSQAASPPAAPGAAKLSRENTSEEKPAKVSIKPKSAKTAAENAQIQEDKARVLFAKYGLELEIGDWKPPVKSNIDRIEKPIRVRVHRTCHHCQTQYGVNTVCLNCNHKRCRKCPRFPGPKKELKAKEVAAPGGAAGYVKRPVTQRTRKICHECKTPFKSKINECDTCHHSRCALCTRESAKPASAPGGAAGKPPPLMQTLWTCHTCQNVHRDPEDPCLRCGHEKCSDCPRGTIKKPAPAANDEAAPARNEGGVEGLEERMKTMGVSPQASAA